MLQNEFDLVSIILFIVFIAILNILYIRYRISKPFDYLLQQMKNKDAIDIKQLHNNFEFEKVSQLYEELRKMQLEIEAKNEQLKVDNKDFILSSIHQLKTPLSAILMNIELLEMTNKADNLQEFISQIKASVDMLNLNSQELVYLSMKDDVEYKITKVAISKLLKERVTFFTQIALAHENSFLIDIEEDILIDINHIEFERLVDNNLSNAIKYSHQNTKIKVILKKNKDAVVLSFESVGKEIENHQKLFDKGYRESKNKDGYGLGLYIIKSICDKYKIKIDLKSKQSVTIFEYVWSNRLNVT